MNEIKEEIKSNLIWLQDEGFLLEFWDSGIYKNTFSFRIWKSKEKKPYSLISNERFTIGEIFDELRTLFSSLSETKRLTFKNIYIICPIGKSYDRVMIKPEEYFNSVYSNKEINSIVFCIAFN